MTAYSPMSLGRRIAKSQFLTERTKSLIGFFFQRPTKTELTSQEYFLFLDGCGVAKTPHFNLCAPSINQCLPTTSRVAREPLTLGSTTFYQGKVAPLKLYPGKEGLNRAESLRELGYLVRSSLTSGSFPPFPSCGLASLIPSMTPKPMSVRSTDFVRPLATEVSSCLSARFLTIRRYFFR